MKLTKDQLERTAWSNLIINITGESKSGKTHLAVRCRGPRYIANLDRNTSLSYQLVRADEEGFTWTDLDEVETITPIPYSDLTVEEAEKRVRLVETLARRAIEQSKASALLGRHGGTFIIDGALLLKGYIEKWKLGESSTLGYRAKRGERGVSTLQYAESNSYLNDFIGRFAGQNIDLILTWEGRRVWENFSDDAGVRQSRPTNRFRSSGPESMSFAINAEVQTVAIAEPIVENNRVTDQYRIKHRVLIGYNAFSSNLRGRMVVVDSFNELKELFLDGIEDSRFIKPEAEVVEIAE